MCLRKFNVVKTRTFAQRCRARCRYSAATTTTKQPRRRTPNAPMSRGRPPTRVERTSKAWPVEKRERKRAPSLEPAMCCFNGRPEVTVPQDKRVVPESPRRGGLWRTSTAWGSAEPLCCVGTPWRPVFLLHFGESTSGALSRFIRILVHSLVPFCVRLALFRTGRVGDTRVPLVGTSVLFLCSVRRFSPHGFGAMGWGASWIPRIRLDFLCRGIFIGAWARQGIPQSCSESVVQGAGRRISGALGKNPFRIIVYRCVAVPPFPSLFRQGERGAVKEAATPQVLKHFSGTEPKTHLKEMGRVGRYAQL